MKVTAFHRGVADVVGRLTSHRVGSSRAGTTASGVTPWASSASRGCGAARTCSRGMRPGARNRGPLVIGGVTVKVVVGGAAAASAGCLDIQPETLRRWIERVARSTPETPTRAANGARSPGQRARLAPRMKRGSRLAAIRGVRPESRAKLCLARSTRRSLPNRRPFPPPRSRRNRSRSERRSGSRRPPAARCCE